MMKILLATHFFPPGAAGGTESYTLGLARRLLAMGHQPYVVCAEEWGKGTTAQPRHRDTRYDNIPVRRLAWNWQAASDPFVNLYDNPAVERHVADYLEQLQPDVMHITSCYSLGAGVIRAARRANIPTILTLTDFWFISPRQTLLRGDNTLCPGPTAPVNCARCQAHDAPVYRWLGRAVPSEIVARGLVHVSRWPMVARQPGLRGYVGDVAVRSQRLRALFDLVDVAIAPSQALKDIYVRNGYPAGRLQVSNYGLELGWLNDVRERDPRNGVCFGFAGQLEQTKGVDLLVQAFRQLPRDSSRLKIFGGLDKNPAFTRRLRDLAGEDPRIQFMGQFERDMIAEVFSQIDCLVVPSVWLENTPVVINEAFAARRPVIATDLPGMTELVKDNVNGLVFKRADVVGLTHAMQRFAEDRELRARLGRATGPVRTIESEAAFLVDMYGDLALAQRPTR